MDRRRFLRAVAVGALASAGGGLVSCTDHSEADGPGDDIGGLPVPDWLAGSLSVDAVTTSLTIDGGRLAFEPVGSDPRSRELTAFGMATVSTVCARSGAVTRETTITAPDGMEDTYLVEQCYSFAQPVDVDLDEVEVLTASVTGHDLRLVYGPANDTSYMVEDHLNIPAVPGYAKGGDMLSGGLPLNVVWGPGGGLTVGVLTAVPGTYEVPLVVTEDAVRIGHRYRPRPELGQRTTFGPGETYATDVVFVSFHRGDFFQPIDRYTKLLERVSGRVIQDQPAPAFAATAYWKTWGLDPAGSGDFTKGQVRAIAGELEELSIDWILLDWGWFTAEGNWSPNDDIFDGEADFAAFVSELRGRGFHVGLWFQPLQVDLTDDDIGPLTPLLVRNPAGDPFIDDDGLALLDPSDDGVVRYVAGQLDRFAALGIDHLYLDSQIAQLASPPNFAKPDPLASHRALPALYHEIRSMAEDRNMIVEICPDGRSQSILNVPQHVNNVGDPKNDQQLRAELKSLKAVLGGRAIVGAYVDPFEDNGVSGSFLNIIGTGAMLQTMFRHQDDLGQASWAAAMDLYRRAGLTSGRYLDLYDIGFDHPEGHAVVTATARYYSFFTRTDPVEVRLGGAGADSDLVEVEAPQPVTYRGRLALRGLDPGTRYRVERHDAAGARWIGADGQGEIVLDDEEFDREVLFVVSH